MTKADVIAVAAMIFAAVAMLAFLAICKRFVTDSETLRKLAHIGTGALAIPFPWLFSSLRPVLLVCGLSLVLLIIVSRMPRLRAQFGSSIYSVDRQSRGEFYFPISVAILFGLAHNNIVLYLIPLLVLTFADAVAALLGGIYGKVSYQGVGGKKSVEGSVGFFTIAFFAVHVPLLLLTELSRPQTLLIALDIALVATLLEAIAWRGLDNVFIPLGGFLLLHIYTALPVIQLVYRFIAAVILLAAVMLYRSRTTLQASGLIASALVLYASWGAGGWEWLVPPAILFASYSLLLPSGSLQSPRTDTVYAVTSVAFAGLFWLFIAKVNARSGLILPYTTAYAIHLAILGWTLSVRLNPAQRIWRRGPLLLVQSWVLMFAPYIWLEHASRSAVWHAIAVLPVCASAFTIFYIFEPRQQFYSVDGWRWTRQAALVLFLTSPLAFIGDLR